MIHVANRGCIRRLSFKSMKAARARNLVAIAAIALTTVLFTSLFTIAISITDGFQQANFRQCGGSNHGTFKYLSREQYDELKTDPLIKQAGLRRFLGMPTDLPFHKDHVEISYSDSLQAHWMYCDPIEGRLPAEGTNEAATDTHVLELLGIDVPQLGQQFTVTFYVDGHETTQTFTLCGWWEYDEVIVANHILVPESRVNQVLDETGVRPETTVDGMTGSWNLDVMFANAVHIERDMNRVLANHGFQEEDRNKAGFISTGVNWGYAGAQLAENMDAATLLGLVAVLMLIVFTGYLIIYNVFQISVTGDIRFYGLLKTIGTTPRQLRSILRRQALTLSFAGIFIGLVLGWLLGSRLTPFVIAQLNGVVSVVSSKPVIFLLSGLFSLGTVLLSCHRPVRLAGRVSPIEAIRYTESGGVGKKVRKANKVSLFSMAKANLGRSRGKTSVTVISLSLAVVLVNLTTTFTAGFDMDKYLAKVVSDFVVADAGYFQVGSGFGFREDTALTEETIDIMLEQGSITEGGRVYGKTFSADEFVTEDWYRTRMGRWNSQETLDTVIASMEKNEAGMLPDSVQLYGMEPFALDRLEVVEGSLSEIYEPGSRAIAAVYDGDDYGKVQMDSAWARLGDIVTVRYIEESEYYNPETGEVYGQNIPEDVPVRSRAVKYHDEEYTVAALVMIPPTLSYRYYGNDEYVLNAQTFVTDSHTSDVMLYAFDTADESEADMEAFLADYTQNRNPQTDYESKGTYAAEFNNFRDLFVLLGSALSMVVGFVGVLNFFNAIFTSIMTRRREFAMLQSIGMTGRQLKTMLVWEGLLYAVGSVLLALALTVCMGPLTAKALESMFWFFTYHLTLTPLLLLLPVFVAFGVFLPLGIYRVLARQTIVERLREIE